VGKPHIKKPEAKSGPHIKAPSTASTGSTNHLHPIFCLRYLSNLGDCDSEDMTAFCTRLKELSLLTWQVIMSSPKMGQGHEKIPTKQIKVPLPPFAREADHVLSFRFKGKAPMLGMRVDQTLQFLYLDRRFEAYDHE
jgi:hypothetical protein